MKIKVCGIVDVEQILALDELAIDYIGINFYPQSKRYFHGAKNLSNLCLKYAKLTGYLSTLLWIRCLRLWITTNSPIFSSMEMKHLSFVMRWSHVG